jgi:hypothetical protein
MYMQHICGRKERERDRKRGLYARTPKREIERCLVRGHMSALFERIITRVIYYYRIMVHPILEDDIFDMWTVVLLLFFLPPPCSLFGSE